MPLIWWSLIPAPTCCSGSWPRWESCELLVERLLHLSVEAASDLLKHLLMQGFNIKPQTYADTFLQAGRNGLRNRLVHDDEAIDPSRVFAAAAGHGHPNANLSRDQGPPPRHDRRRC